MTVYLVEVNDGWGAGCILGIFSSKKKAYKALFENGYAIRDFEGRPHWMMVDSYDNWYGQYTFANVTERIVV